MNVTGCNSSHDIAAMLDSVKTSIAERLTNRDIEVYLFLMRRLADTHGQVATDHLFQFVYEAFYGLNRAFLTNKFMSEYFNIMEEMYGRPEIDLASICERLRKLTNAKGRESLQFSFCSKLAATLNADLPLYDKYIAKVFHFQMPSGFDYDKRLERCMDFYRYLEETIASLKGDPQITNLLHFVRKNYSNWDAVTKTKQMDFLLWTAGKVI
jgi:hypothetical protein